VRIPTFSRQTETTDTADPERPATERPATLATAPTPVRPRRDDEAPTTTDLSSSKPSSTTVSPPPAAKPATRTTLPPPPPPAVTRRTGSEPVTEPTPVVTDRTPVVAGPKPRASLLATLGLMLGVASALLVLSGPLLGYGIGVAGLALVLSLAGIHATGKRHVAGKSDALIGMVLSLGAIVVGVLALTGSLSWLGTDMHPVTSLRQWLDVHLVNRF
jgi:hypothetical protein